jgi:hypothetical protein
MTRREALMIAMLYPFPPGADTSDAEAVRVQVANYPHWILALAVVLWGGTVFVSAWIATRLGAGRHPAHGIGVGALLCLAAAVNMSMLPYAIWFEVACAVVFPLAIYFAVRAGRAPRPHGAGGVSQQTAAEVRYEK